MLSSVWWGVLSERVARMVGFVTCVPSKVSLVLEVLGTDEASLKDDIDYQHDRSRSLRYQDDPRHLHPFHRRHARLRESRPRRDPISIRLLTRLCQRAPEALPGHFLFP